MTGVRVIMSNELECYNCREYFKHNTLIKIDKSIIVEAKEKQKEIEECKRELGELRKDYFSVIEKEIRRQQIRNIFFLDYLPSGFEAKDYDVSCNKDGSVRLWVKENKEGYDLYIGGKGGVKAPKNCRALFCGFDGVEQIKFQKNFKTENVKNMCGMFAGCCSLETLDLSNFDTGNVLDMSRMFSDCTQLKKYI